VADSKTAMHQINCPQTFYQIFFSFFCSKTTLNNKGKCSGRILRKKQKQKEVSNERRSGYIQKRTNSIELSPYKVAKQSAKDAVQKKANGAISGDIKSKNDVKWCSVRECIGGITRQVI